MQDFLGKCRTQTDTIQQNIPLADFLHWTSGHFCFLWESSSTREIQAAKFKMDTVFPRIEAGVSISFVGFLTRPLNEAGLYSGEASKYR